MEFVTVDRVCLVVVIAFLLMVVRGLHRVLIEAEERGDRWHRAYQRKRDEVDRLEAQAHGVGGIGEAERFHVTPAGTIPMGTATRIGKAGRTAYVPIPTDAKR